MSTKVVQCNLCKKKLCDRRILKKHLMAVHNIDPVKADYICGHCETEDKSLRVIWEHVVERHKTITVIWEQVVERHKTNSLPKTAYHLQ